ncbi:hypothetical protein M413DRAFT_147525 [Hebeloma cylindrosporum]|uniref:Uncharacterized protein n=1 Tax=Hebeloma cylindrosporum TaxID=76867 RepID=A0A0C2YK12_HEBCY|nr:hypothetical protein M413DRAFT_147525 [Hebeloma cylindrosporum h7]
MHFITFYFPFFWKNMRRSEGASSLRLRVSSPCSTIFHIFISSSSPWALNVGHGDPALDPPI